MKQISKCFKILLLLFLFSQCEKDTEFIESTPETGNHSSFKVTTVSAKQLSGITRFLETEIHAPLFQKDTVAGAIFDTDNIIEVIDTLNTANYSFRFVYSDTPEHVFYNLIIGIDDQGNYNTPYVLKYECDAAYLQTFIDSNYNFHYFKGSISHHRFTDFFQNDDLFNRTATECVQFDQYGDPIACEQTLIDGSGPSASGGSTEVESTTGETVSGTGSPGGNGGFSITVYHIIPSGDWYVFGPESVCQHPGECEIVIAMNGSQNEQQRTASECPPCTMPTGGVGVSTSYPLAVNQLNLTLDGNLSDTQLDWLEVNPDITQQFNDLLTEYNFSEEAKNATLMSISSLMNDNLQGPYDAGFYNQINAYTQLDMTDPATAAIWASYFSTQCAILKINNPEWSDLRVFWEASREMLHLVLDIGGLVPVIGEICDIANGVIYTIEGDGVNAALSYSAAVPVAGWFATGAKFAYKGSLKFVVKADGLIDFGSRNSKRFREALGLIPGDGKHAHHIIPWDFKTSNLVQKAAKSKDAFHINEVFNGIPLPSTNHLTGHNLYNAKIENIFTYLNETYPNMDPTDAYNHMNSLINQIKDLIIANPNMNIGQISDLINYP